MKVMMFLTVLVTINSTAFASSNEACTSEVLKRASMVKATAQDIVRTTDDALDQRLDQFGDQQINAAELTESTKASELIQAIRELQLASKDGVPPKGRPAPLVSELCKNMFSVQKTVLAQ